MIAVCLALDKGRELRGNHVLGVGLRYGGALHGDAARTGFQAISLGRCSEWTSDIRGCSGLIHPSPSAP